jgi:hypothetical protein
MSGQVEEGSLDSHPSQELDQTETGTEGRDSAVASDSVDREVRETPTREVSVAADRKVQSLARDSEILNPEVSAATDREVQSLTPDSDSRDDADSVVSVATIVLSDVASDSVLYSDSKSDQEKDERAVTSDEKYLRMLPPSQFTKPYRRTLVPLCQRQTT